MKRAASRSDSFTSEIQKARFKNELINNETIQAFIQQSFWNNKNLNDREGSRSVIHSELSHYNHPKREEEDLNSPLSPRRKGS